MCIRAYRTISADAAAVINLSPPLIDRIRVRSIRWLLSKGRAIRQPGIFADLLAETPDPSRSDFQKVIRTAWSCEWLVSKADPWTHQLFPTVEQRARTDLRPTFWLTQGLSGHGVFNAYLERFRLHDAANCPCGYEKEDAEHVFRFCPRFAEGRARVWRRPLERRNLQYMENVVKELWLIENPG